MSVFGFHRLTEQGSLKMETISNYPSIESIICLLGYLNGAAQLLLQVFHFYFVFFFNEASNIVVNSFLSIRASTEMQN